MKNRTAFLPADVGWHNWGRFFTDVDLWRPVVERICRATGITAAENVSAGYPGSCAVFVADSQAVVKLFPPLFSADFDTEREAYRLLEDRLELMPRLLAEGVYRDQIDWPYLILEYRPGTPIRELYDALDASTMLALARELGRAIRIIHTTPLSDVNHFDIRPEAWREFLNRRRVDCLEELSQWTSLSKQVLTELSHLLNSVELLPPPFEPILINADLTEDHLLLAKNGGTWQATALIDWADAEAGDPDYEWIALWYGLCNRDAEMFFEVLRAYDPELTLNAGFRCRMMAYTCLHRFGPEMIRVMLARDGDPVIYHLDALQDQLLPPM